MGVLVGIIIFHLLLLYGLVSGLARKVVEVVAAPLQTDIIEEIKPEDKPPPPPPPQMERPPVQVPPPDVVIDIPMETNTTAISNVTDKPVPVAAPVIAQTVERKPVVVRMKVDPRRSPDPNEFYPASARRAEIEGLVTVQVCAGPDGRVTGDPTVVKSSGNAALDEAAVKWARRARFTPGTEDGNAVAMCLPQPVRFKLTD
jgi:protein TonB